MGRKFTALLKDSLPQASVRAPVPSNSHFGKERDCVVSTSRSSSTKINGLGARSVLRLVLRTQPRLYVGLVTGKR
jgi:hypothetical protein